MVVPCFRLESKPIHVIPDKSGMDVVEDSTCKKRVGNVTRSLFELKTCQSAEVYNTFLVYNTALVFISFFIFLSKNGV